jgi:hypothetical protein
MSESQEGARPEPPMIDVTPEAVATPPAPPRPVRTLSWRDAGWLVLGVVAVLVLSAPLWAPPLGALVAPPPAPAPTPAPLAGLDQRLAALAEHQSALDQHLDRLEQTLARGNEPSTRAEEIAALRQLADRITRLEQRPNAPADATEPAALKDALQRIGDRLDKIEAAPPPAPPPPPIPPPAAHNDRPLLAALVPLRQVMSEARPFAAELAPLETLGRDRPEVKAALAPLEALAGKGVAALAALTQRFEDEVAPAVMRAAKAPEGDDWSDRIWGKLSALVVVRRTGPAGTGASDPVEAALARAEAALGKGDLAGAVAALDGLPSRAAAPAQAWLADANGRLAAEAALAALETLAAAPDASPEQ